MRCTPLLTADLRAESADMLRAARFNIGPSMYRYVIVIEVKSDLLVPDTTAPGPNGEDTDVFSRVAINALGHDGIISASLRMIHDHAGETLQ